MPDDGRGLVAGAPAATTTAPRPAASSSRTPTGEKIGRNDPCYCGSGKKFKRCHGA
jgi:preprotein translocase subunit SecA